jgi:hypothetical protein
MTRLQISIEHVITTFFEAAVAYLIVVPTVNWGKTIYAGAVGAGLSAIYNGARQSTPPTVTESPSPVVSPVGPATPVASTTSPTSAEQGSAIAA